MTEQSSSSGITRRAFVVRGGATAAVLYLPGQAIARAATAGALSAPDFATHEALYEALAGVPRLGLRKEDARERTELLSRALLHADKKYRQQVHVTLRALADGRGGTRFTALKPRARRRLLQAPTLRERSFTDPAVALVVHPIYVEVEPELVREVAL